MIKSHLIEKDASVNEALLKLNKLASDAVLFLVDKEQKLIGSLTDGDIRRGLISGLTLETSLVEFVQSNPSYVYDGKYELEKLEFYKSKLLRIIPVLNHKKQVVDIINFRFKTTILPLDAVIMAGGKGTRLLPLTEKTPKPMLKIGDKPIIEHNVNRLSKVGIKNLYISLNYLGGQIETHFSNPNFENLNIQYVRENEPLGTIGSVGLIDSFVHEEILVMNCDILSNIDFSNFYKFFKETKADMAVAAIPYDVNIPYAVLETNELQEVLSLKEKPKYTYYSNAGIYLIKKSLMSLIPKGSFYDVTTLMEKIMELNYKLMTYTINGYWLDIGKKEDLLKAKHDIKNLQF